MKIIPYIEVNGIRTMSDAYMAGLFRQMQEEGTAKRVWHSGTIQTEQEFVRWMKNPIIYSMLITDDEGAPLILSWIAGVEEGRGWFNFCVFKKAWGRKKSEEVGRAAAQYWLRMRNSKGEPVFHVLLGITPSTNRLALSFIRACGAKSLGPPVPSFGADYWTGQRYDAVISYIEGER